MRDPSTLALELLHGAAFRNSGLGNSIFVPDYQLGKLSQGVVCCALPFVRLIMKVFLNILEIYLL